jgi:hypothetical protein
LRGYGGRIEKSVAPLRRVSGSKVKFYDDKFACRKHFLRKLNTYITTLHEMPPSLAPATKVLIV